MSATSQNRRLILSILAIIAGLFMLTLAPILIQVSLERVLAALIEVSKERPAFQSGIMLFSLSYPFYRGLIFIGGMALVLLARPIYQGREWAYPAALLASAFPSAGGMFMFLPYISWVGGFPLPMVISWVGLAFFWSLILLRQVDQWQKWSQFLVLTFSGMLTTHAFVIGIGNLRMLLTRPGRPLFGGLEWWVLAWSAPIQWMCVILLFVAIYLIGARRVWGWRLALLAGFSILAIDAPTQVIRTALTDSTSLDYLYGALLSLGLLCSLLFPRFKNALLEPDHEPVVEEPGTSGAVPTGMSSPTAPV